MNNNEAQVTNFNLYTLRLGLSQGVFPTREEASAWAQRNGLRCYGIAPINRPCWTLF